MKSIKLIYSNFDEDTGISKVKIRTDLGEFEGSSKLHEEDKKIVSHFAGCQYAEMRAIIKYMKTKIKIIKIQIKELEDFQKSLSLRNDYNHYSIENCKMRRRIYMLNKQVKDWQERAQSLNKKMLSMMEKREHLIEEIIKKGEKK